MTSRTPVTPSGRTPTLSARRARTLTFAAGLVLIGLAPRPLHGQAPDPAKALTQLRLDSWDDRHGLPGNGLHAIVQSADGYLWIGTEEGVARFDGTRFEVYTPRDTAVLRTPYARALLATSDGTLWIGIEGGGLVRVRDGRFTHIGKREGLSSDQVVTLAAARDGGVWVGTAGGGLNHVGGGRIRTYTGAEGLAHDFVTAVMEEPDGTVWVGTPVGVSRLRNGTIVNFTARDGIPGESVGALLRTSRGDVLVGSTAGVAVYRRGTAHRFSQIPELRGVHVRTLLEDSRGTLWIGTHGSGLLRLVGNRLSALTTQEGLGADLVRALYEDREGGIWIGSTGGGLQRLRETLVTVYGSPEGLPTEIALAVLQDRDRGMWIGTAGGGLARLANGAFTTLTAAEGLAHNVILSLAQDREGVLWVGTVGGLNRVAQGHVTTFRVRDGLSANAVLATLVDAKGALWLGTDGGGMQRWRPGAPVTYRKSDGLPSDVVTAFAETPDGDLWIGTREGLARRRAGIVETYDAGHGVTDILALHVDDAGTLWIGLGHGGLARLRSGRVTRVTTADGLADDVVNAILDDGSGGLWLSGSKGISRLAKRDIEAYMDATDHRRPLRVRLFGVAEGMRTREANGGVFPSAWRAHDGRLWFPTLRGVVVIDPAHVESRSTAPPVHIERVIVGDSALPRTDVMTIPSGVRDLRFEFAAVSFTLPERARFRYRLDGFDTTWVDGGGVRSARYTNIPPGTYAFRVTAANADGVWNQSGDAVSVHLAARFHETTLFRLVAGFWVIAALVAAAAGLHRRRVRQLQKREQALVGLVADRTRAEERYRELFENATDAVFTTDLAGQLTSVNRRFAELAGYDRADLLGRSIETMLVGTYGNGRTLPVSWREPMAAAAIGLARKDGRVVPLEISTRFITEGSAPTGIQAMARDVTERKQLEQRLLQAQRMEALGQLAGGVAHDFNNILVAITAYSEFLLEELPAGGPLRCDAAEINKAAQRAAMLTRQLLAFSRQQVLQPRVLLLNDVVTDLQKMLVRLLREDITLRLALTPSAGAVAADPGQLEQVLLNLVVNARDAMPGGGAIIIETANVRIADSDSAPYHGATAAPGTHTMLAVSDTGTGMTPEVRERIFEPFFTTKEQGKGTGLGLSTVHGIIEQSGGSITCESEPGRGTTFRIYLPHVDVGRNVLREPAALTPAARGSETVLLVEDDAAVRSAARRMLEKRGFRVVEAPTGADAIARCAEPGAVIHVVVTDVIMPEMNGHDLALRLRERYPQLRVLFMSGYTRDAVLRKDILQDAHGFVEKPFTLDELARKVREVLDGGLVSSEA